MTVWSGRGLWLHTGMPSWPHRLFAHGERAYSEEGQSGPLQQGLRVLMGRAAQPLTLFSTNK